MVFGHSIQDRQHLHRFWRRLIIICLLLIPLLVVLGCARVNIHVEKIGEREVSAVPIGEPRMVTQQERNTVSGAVARSSRGSAVGVGASQAVTRSYEQCMQRHQITIEERYQGTPHKTGILSDILWGSLFVAVGIGLFAEAASSDDVGESIGGGFVGLGMGGGFLFNGIRVIRHTNEPKTITHNRTRPAAVWRETNTCGGVIASADDDQPVEEMPIARDSSDRTQRSPPSTSPSELEACFTGTRCISSSSCLSGDICNEARRECVRLNCVLSYFEHKSDRLGAHAFTTARNVTSAINFIAENRTTPPTQRSDTFVEDSSQTTYSLSEAAAICGVSEAAVAEWITSGLLRAVHVDNVYRISRQALQESWREMGGGELFGDH